MDPFPLPAFRARGVKHVPEASISSHITDLINPHILASIKDGHKVLVQVIGSDLPNLISPDYPGWRPLLAKWLDAGVTVEYVAVDSTGGRLAEAVAGCQEVLKSCKSPTGDLSLFQPGAANLDSDTQEMLAELIDAHRERHFLLALDINDMERSQMWIENEHKAGATKAYDCYYYEPGLASSSPEFVQNRSNFEFLKENSRCVEIADKGHDVVEESLGV